MLIDFTVFNIINKIKPNLEILKKDLEFDKNVLKIIFKKNDLAQFKILNKYIYLALDNTVDIKTRKNLMNSIILIFKLNGKTFFNNFVENLICDVESGGIKDFLNVFDFSILNEGINYKFYNIEIPFNYFRCFDIIISDVFEFESEKNQEKRLEIQNFLFKILKNVIIFCEMIWRMVQENKSINLKKYLDFYYFLQIKVNLK